MLKKILSEYFIKNIFLNINEKQKLEIMKYNKNLQRLNDISLKNYRRFSDNYIFFISKGNGKEYNKYGNIIYEGEFLNGKRNGKGKEYDIRGNLRYDGEFLKGERNGKGKEYSYYNKLIFEGEYLNGKRWNGKVKFGEENYELKNGNGFIKEYISYSYIFEGEYLNGQRNGKGKEYREDKDENNLLFDGEYLNGKRWNGKINLSKQSINLKNGSGFVIEFDNYYNKNGEIIQYSEGNYFEGEKNGYWYENNSSNNYYSFSGEYLNGKKNGKGKESLFYSLYFEGEYLNGKKWNGIEYNSNYNIKNEIKNGKGIIRKYGYDKLIYEEEYIDGKLTREAKEYTYLNGGLIYIGEVLNQKRNGKGKEYNSINGSLKFEGEYLLGERHGKGKEYKNGKLRFEGEYINGKRNGKGKEYNDKGELIFEGEYQNGEKKIE